MKNLYKVLLVAIAILFVAGSVFANSEITSSDNAVIFGPVMGPKGITAPVEVIKVYLHSQASASVGDVVAWNMTAIDGYTVDLLTFDQDTAAATNVVATVAGVMVTITSQVSSASSSTPKATGPNVGYMAIRGFCPAKVDTSRAETGRPLIANGATLTYSFATAPHTASAATKTSQDIGVLLLDAGADGLMRVWLRM